MEFENISTEVEEKSFMDSLNESTEEDQYNQPPPPAAPQPAVQPAATPAPEKPVLDDEQLQVVVDSTLEIIDTSHNLLCQKIAQEYDKKLFETNRDMFQKLKDQANRIAKVMVKEKPNPWVVLILLLLVCYIAPTINAFSLKRKKKMASTDKNMSPGELAEAMKILNNRPPGRPSIEETNLQVALEAYRKKNLKKAA